MKPASSVLMIRPVNFGFNEQTAASNAFQTREPTQKQLQWHALEEFEKLSGILRENGVTVVVVDDTPEPHKPDSIFPNNWISTHENGDIILYPMEAENRRPERRNDILHILKQRYIVNTVFDLSYFENSANFLEGTGSMVLDRENKIVYVSVSTRTSLAVLNEFCIKTGYGPVVFHSTDDKGIAIYHTNVMMCLGNEFVVICLEAINDMNEKWKVEESLKASEKEIIEITRRQMKKFAGNMIQLSGRNDESLIVMSDAALACLEGHQKDRLKRYGRLVHAPLDTIERTGGGSARCMIAEIYLPVL